MGRLSSHATNQQRTEASEESQRSGRVGIVHNSKFSCEINTRFGSNPFTIHYLELLSFFILFLILRLDHSYAIVE